MKPSSPEARMAAGLARRVARGVITGGSSLVLELKLLAVALGMLLVLVLLLGTLLVVAGGKAEALTGAGVTPTCKGVPQSPPEDLMSIYTSAADKYKLGEDGWAYLAAINRIETNFGTNTSNSSANAKGWMQFIDSTWAAYGVDGDGDGTKNVQDPDDAIFGAANYLHASGAPGDWYKAIYAYNHADWYVQDVLEHAETYRGGCGTTSYVTTQTVAGAKGKLLPGGTALAPADAPEKVKQIIAAANKIVNKPYVWGGGHGAWEDNGYDCSGLVSYALHGAGLVSSPMTSGNYMRWGGQGPGSWVTVYSNAGHVFMIVAGLRLDTGGGDRRGTAWRTPERAKKRSFSGFSVTHPPGL
jgi:cell wall-associated NlpC family hydrolase